MSINIVSIEELILARERDWLRALEQRVTDLTHAVHQPSLIIQGEVLVPPSDPLN